MTLKHQATNSEVSLTPRGFIAFRIGACQQNVCEVVVPRLHITLPNFSIAGQSFSNVAVGFSQDVSGTLLDGTQFRLPNAAAVQTVRGRIGGETFDREGPVSSASAVVGRLDLDAGTLLLDFVSESAPLGVRLVAELDARLQSRPPRPSFQAQSVVECSQRGGSLVDVDATATVDPDEANTELSYRWYVDELPAGGGRIVDRVFVPLGTHVVHLRVMDSDALIGTVEKTVQVVDTRPPSFSGLLFTGDSCLWPPNHEYSVIDLARDVQASVVDACDANLVVRFGSVTSNQPDDGQGDGQTNNDVVPFVDHVCLRRERQGTVLEGRQYTLDVEIIDAAGNRASQTIVARVPHDRGTGECVPLPGGEAADEGSPRCTPIPEAATETQETVPSPASGCTSVPVALGWVALSMLSRRRRERS